MPVHLPDSCDRAMTIVATDGPTRINDAPLQMRIAARCDRQATITEGRSSTALRSLPSLRATGSRECAPDDRLREAIHSAHWRDGLLRRVAPRNDDVPSRYTFTTPRRATPESCWNSSPSKTEGAGKTGCALHPRSRVRFAQTKVHTSIQVQRKHSGLPCAMALRLISCSCVNGFLATVAAPTWALRNLTPAPRRQDHTTSPYASCAFVLRAFRVHRIPPRVRDVRTPLLSGETGRIKPLICPTAKAEYFPHQGLTGFY
jgi:hypothetical protein